MLATKDAAKIFSSKGINEIADGDFSLALQLAGLYQEKLAYNFSILNVLEECYKDLKKSYKFEYYIKNIIAEKILLGRHSLNTSTLLNEFRVGESRADCVIFNGITTCYEIKSEFDSVARLESQLRSYLQIFDKVNVVTTDNHIDKVLRISPEAVGVIRLGKNDRLTQIREAQLSSEDIDSDILIASLRQHEYIALTTELCRITPRSPNTEIYDECRSLLRTVGSPELRAAFCKIVKKTRRLNQSFINGLPRVLLSAAIEYRISAAAKRRLQENINIHFSKEAICTIPSSKQSVMS
ncbi:sce7726 family protein [Pseudomonas syringae]|uniref:sce7726 family protein n=1 Tax=Pseudomonas syringae TaxID=317 RepID=UPI0011819FD4|nr:sce7726 family protein [Pseudomonas syringae]